MARRPVLKDQAPELNHKDIIKVGSRLKHHHFLFMQTLNTKYLEDILLPSSLCMTSQIKLKGGVCSLKGYGLNDESYRE